MTIPITCPPRLSSGPPEFPGLTAASNWMSPRSVLPSGVSTVRSRPEMTPERQRAEVAERVPHGVRLVAHLAAAAEHRRDDRLRGAVRDEHRDVVVGVGGDDPAVRPRAVDEGQPDRPRAVDHVERGQDRAARVDDHAGAESGAVRLSTTARAPRSGRARAGSAGRRAPRSPVPRAGPRSPCRRRRTRSLRRRPARPRAPTGRSPRGPRSPPRPPPRESPRSRSGGAGANGRPGGRLVGCGGRRLAGLCARRHPGHARAPDRCRFGEIIP